MNSPDELLAIQAAGGDQAAFGTLYERYERRVYGLCYRLTGSADDAADATQDAFVKLLEKLPRGKEPVRNFASYVLTVARNASFDLIARRRRAEPVEETPEPVRAEPVAPQEDPERAVLHQAGQAQVEAANRRLDPRHREVLALREAEELSYDEIADIMGMNRNSVAQLILRARAALRRELRRGAVAAIVPLGPDCERADPMICARQDGERVAAHDVTWLDGHLLGCARCRLAGEELADVSRSYRAWLPVPALVGLREAVFGSVAEAFGFEWTIAGAGAGGGASSATGSTTAGSAGATAKGAGAVASHKALVAAVAATAVVAGGAAANGVQGFKQGGGELASAHAIAQREAEERRQARERRRAERRRAAARRRERARLEAAAAPVPVEPAPAGPAPAPAAPAPAAPVPAPTPGPEPVSPELEITPE